MSSPPLDMAKGQDAAPEDGPKVEGIEISLIHEDEGSEPSLGLVAILALTQGRKSYFWLQNQMTGKWSMRSLD